MRESDVPKIKDDIQWHDHAITREMRWAHQKTNGCTIWLTGLSGAGKSTIANAAARQLFDAGVPAYVLDGDNLRHGLNADLGFTDADRQENVRRVGEVSVLLADAGYVVFAPVISPFSEGRDQVRAYHHASGLGFAEVFVATTVEQCAERDTKGLYAKASRGEIHGLSGVDAPYEVPGSPELVLVTSDHSVNACAEELVSALHHLWDRTN